MNISSPTAARIFAAWEREGRAERPRTYLGASIVGHACDMYLWLQFRGVVRERFDGRMYRLFDRGRREEAVFASDLRRIGCEVREFDEHGDQFAVSAIGGHFGGHLDGLVRGLDEAPKQWFVTEFKTHSDASFKKLCKEGVAQAKPMHYAQMQTYMGHTGLKKALYLAVNKDNDDLWTETVNFDPKAFESVMARARHIIDTTDPDKCATRPDDFRCKACPCHGVCWDTETCVNPIVPFACRTCCHATADTAHEGAAWTCRLGHSCSTERAACADFLLLPALVNGEVVDGGADAINYTHGKHTFSVRKGADAARELTLLAPDMVDGAELVKDAFPGARVTGSSLLKDKYATKGKYYQAFRGNASELAAWIAENPWYDWSKPNVTEEFAGVTYCEYEDCTLVAVGHGRAEVISENPPF